MRNPAPPLLVLCCLVLLFGCTDNSELARTETPLPLPATHAISFEQDVRPILDAKCLACHGCYDAPCQLKFETPAGLVRGGHPQPAYDGTRKEAMAPTRLGLDALSEAGWRARGFHSVLAATEAHQPVLYRMLALGKQHPWEPNSKLPDDIDISISRPNECPTSEEFDRYAKKHPLEGMPLAVTGLDDEEFSLISGWLKQGAEIDTPATVVSAAEQQVIDRWESFLNQRGNQAQLLSRWLFEHLFLAHLYFEDIEGEPRFFQLLRSYTPPGEPILPVATVRPNDAPDSPFFYRLRPMDDTIVYKRHIAYPLSDTKLARIRTLFFSEDWQVDSLPGYSYEDRANPFTTFAAIPAAARYQFMLDEAEYFTRTFIRGPVCRGQIATDVIRDHFWTFFQKPENDQYIVDAEYRARATPLLGLPGQHDALLDAGDEWQRYRDNRNQYLQARQAQYRRHQPGGASLEDIWQGNDNALLTILRHHDSASVRRGLIGEIPQTMWLMDYPLFERTYYELVVNFDVFGNVAHQLQTRLYFDLIRNGAEQNFLRLLPADQRAAVLADWYRGMGKLKLDITYQDQDTRAPSAERYLTDMPTQEFALRLLTHTQGTNAQPEDLLNRCQPPQCGRRDVPAWVQRADQALASLAATPAAKLPGLLHLPEAIFVRVHHPQGERTVYSVLRNRAHSNVAFLMGESLRYEAEQDTLTVYPGIIGGYPNFMFDVPASDAERFASALRNAEQQEQFEQVVEQWGVRRTHPQFWEILHDITAWHREHEPLQAGVFDINRFENL